MQHQRRLAGPVRPEQRDPFAAAATVQVDAEERLVAVGVGEGEARDLQGRGRGIMAVTGSIPGGDQRGGDGETAAYATGPATPLLRR